MQCKARPQVGCPNAMQGEFARWAPKRKTNPQQKRPHKGALGKKTSWRMDKNKFWLGGRLFNTASPRLGALTQRKARPQDGRPNATQDLSASWAPQRNTRHVRKLRSPTYVCNANARHVPNARHVVTSAKWGPQRNARHVVTSAKWAPQRNARHVHKLGAPTHVRLQGASTRRVNNRNARHVCKMGAQTKNRSATKASTQGSTRLKDELEDG
jgi:hypothetical protein